MNSIGSVLPTVGTVFSTLALSLLALLSTIYLLRSRPRANGLTAYVFLEIEGALDLDVKKLYEIGEELGRYEKHFYISVKVESHQPTEVAFR